MDPASTAMQSGDAGLLIRETTDLFTRDTQPGLIFATIGTDDAQGALVPGTAFGLSTYFRLSYSLDTAQLRTAIERLRRDCNEVT